jgi:hypothetical protein
VYVNDLNIIGTYGEIPNTINYLKKEFEMKDLGKNNFFSQPANRAFSR